IRVWQPGRKSLRDPATDFIRALLVAFSTTPARPGQHRALSLRTVLSARQRRIRRNNLPSACIFSAIIVYRNIRLSHHRA
ncbi:MAG TPA: hypothetical protein VGL77_06020, partial [Armatimonadota bacterium]